MGYIDDYLAEREYSFSCCCLLTPRGQGELGKRLCQADCPILITERTYIDCEEDEIQNRIISPSIFGLSSFNKRTRDSDNVVVRGGETPNIDNPESWREWAPDSPGPFFGDAIDDGWPLDEGEVQEGENDGQGDEEQPGWGVGNDENVAWGENDDDVVGWGGRLARAVAMFRRLVNKRPAKPLQPLALRPKPEVVHEFNQ